MDGPANQKLSKNVIRIKILGLDAEFKVYDLAELAMNLQNNCTPDKFDNNTLAMMAFEKDAYEYTVGLACEVSKTYKKSLSNKNP